MNRDIGGKQHYNSAVLLVHRITNSTGIRFSGELSDRVLIRWNYNTAEMWPDNWQAERFRVLPENRRP